MLPTLCFVDIKINILGVGSRGAYGPEVPEKPGATCWPAMAAATQLFSSHYFAAIRAGLQSLATEQNLK